MAQWGLMSKLLPYMTPESVDNLYPPDAFPIYVRHLLADWIEKQRWEDFELDKLDQRLQAQALLEGIISYLRTKAETETNVEMFRPQALKFGVMVRDILRKERLLINKAAANPPHVAQSPSREPVLPSISDVDDLVYKVLYVQECRQKIHRLQEDLNWDRQNFETELSLQGPAQQNGMDPQNTELQKLQNKLQQLECEQLLGLNGKLREEGMLAGKPIPELQERLAGLQQALIERTLLVEKQPPQVIKTQSKFSTTVRYLLGEKVAPGKPVVVKAQIITEAQARILNQHGVIPIDNVGELINNTAILEINPTNKNTCATFRNMLREEGMLAGKPIPELQERLAGLQQALIERTLLVEKQPPQVIKTQSKFSTTVRYLLGEKVAPGKPVVVKAQIITEAQARILNQHGVIPIDNVGELINNTAILEINPTNKNTCATFRNMSVKKIKRADRKGTESVTEEKFALLFSTEITITGCDTPFRIQDRIPFEVPDRVPWKLMCMTLNSKFMSEVRTQHCLNQYNLHFLAQKIFDQPDISGDFTKMMVSWAQFNKHLHLILNERPNGTFLLRFSDSEIGGITIAYVAASENGGQKIQNIQPFLKKDLEIRCLGNIIGDIKFLAFLYPDIPKNGIFEKEAGSTSTNVSSMALDMSLQLISSPMAETVT
ncbi:hypothetical protein CRUP_034028 [Coryphaenoides rupestris]|nr:hypothetical protein CRUP_034028 [Coryphaenoides rupestris]